MCILKKRKLGMIDENLISFCIPTYNRAVNLEVTIKSLIENIGGFNFKIIVTDNASTDETPIIIERFKKQYSNILYIVQTENLGADKNFESALTLSVSDYSMLLGDSCTINKDTFLEIINLLNLQLYDMLFLNSKKRVKNIDSRCYYNPTDILTDIGWHITLMSSLIYHKKVIQKSNFKRYYNTNFIQHGIVLEYLCAVDKSISYWFSKDSLVLLEKKNTWRKDTMLIFCKNWATYILSLPAAISLPVKFKCIKDHGVKSGLFSCRNLLGLKKENYLNFNILKEHNSYIKIATYSTTYFFLIFLLFIPSAILRLIYKVMSNLPPNYYKN